MPHSFILTCAKTRTKFLCQQWRPKQLNRSSDAMSQYIMLFHSNYHSTLSINVNHRSIYNDNMATRAPSQVRLIFYCLSATDRVTRLRRVRLFFTRGGLRSYTLVTILGGIYNAESNLKLGRQSVDYFISGSA